MRLERVAYKKIASHLDKTELACRLHYHQLSHGGNRRKRNNSVSSTSSNASAQSPAASPATESPASKLPPTSSFSPVNAAGAIQKASGANTTPKAKGKHILPKPADGSLASSPRRPASAKGAKLRVHCNPDSIDKEKLRKIVKANEAKFWESIAAQYGGSIEGEYLRTIYQKSTKESPSSSGPPTPAISPASQATSPVATEMQIDEGNVNTIATVSEVSTPVSSALSPTAVAFNGSEVASIREESMELEQECKQQIMQTMQSGQQTVAV